MSAKMYVQKLRREYQSLDERQAQDARDRFTEYLEKLVAHYGVYTKSTNRLNIAGTLTNLGASKDDQRLFNNWREGTSNPLSGNHSREQNIDLLLRFHLYEFELDESQPLDFVSVSEAFNHMLDKLGLEPLYIFNRTDFCALLAMKLQSYEEQAPRDVFVEIYNAFKDLRNILPAALAAPQALGALSTRTEYVDVTDTAFVRFVRIRSLGQESDKSWPVSEIAPITAFQFIHHYRESFDRVRVSPFLVLAECFRDEIVNWEGLEKKQLTSLAQDNIEAADQLSDEIDLWDETLPPAVRTMLRSLVGALQYGRTMDRSSLILFCALLMNEKLCRGIMGKDPDRDKLLSYFNEMILEPCGYSPMNPDRPPQSKEELAVLAAIRDADPKSSHGYPLGEYICNVFFECEFTVIMDPVTAAIFA